MYYPAIFRTVLICDEDASVLDLMKRVLSAQEYAVQCPPDWQIALDVIRRTPPAIIFVDAEFLGNHLQDFIARIHARHPELPVVLMHAQAAERYEEPEEITYTHWMRKPFTAEEFIAEFHNLVYASVT